MQLKFSAEKIAFGYLRVDTTSYLKVDRKYWYPDDPPVPSCAEPIILWTMITWLSANE